MFSILFRIFLINPVGPAEVKKDDYFKNNLEQLNQHSTGITFQN